MLLLTWRGAAKETYAPYHAVAFAPCVPLVIYGRDAKAEPEVPENKVVFYAWRDLMVYV